MNILIVYATNSGSTFLVTQKIQSVLESQQHQVTVKDVQHLDAQEVSNFDFILFGSNSWDYQGKEGQPHHAFMKFVEDHQDVNWSGKKFAIYGCGDKTYMIFCGALDVIQEFVTSNGGQVIHEPLRIDRFYFNDQDQIFQNAEAWTNEVLQKVNT